MLGEAAGHAKNGKAQQAARSLADLREQLAQIEREASELALLDGALAELADCKRAMACKNCNGEGCDACRNHGEGFSTHNLPGSAHGRQHASQTKIDAHLYDSQVKQTIGQGPLVIEGRADGPNRKGQVQQEIQAEFEGAQQQASSALSEQRLPHDYRDHAQEYFDALRQGRP